MNTQNTALAAQHYTRYLPLIIRLTTGWIYFSAFWRRVALSNKLNPESIGYIGEKFNNFLPNALFIKPMIQWLVENPDALWINMIAFTIIEGIVGLFLILGLFTRLSALGATLLALGILLGAGWLGTTCLDEWQIGVFGIITGAYLFFSGGGTFSLDKKLHFGSKFNFWMSGDLNEKFSNSFTSKAVIITSVSAFIITLGTNQYFHGGVWGKLHNLSKNPKIELYSASFQNDFVEFEAMRIEGIDTYGSFVIEARLTDASGTAIYTWDDAELAQMDKTNIVNKHVASVKIGKHGLEFPLGALASIKLPLQEIIKPAQVYSLVLEDVSGETWSIAIN